MYERMGMAALAGALLLLAGCGEAPTEPASAPVAPADQPTVLPPAASNAAAPATPATPAYQIAIEAEGLRFVDAETGRASPLSFGATADQATTAVERLRGPATKGRNDDCMLDYAAWPDGFSLSLKDGKFVGWSLDRRSTGKITTLAGVGIGSIRKALEDAYSAKVEETSLGQEFDAGFSGVLDGEGPAAKITDMWSGETCIFR